MAPSSTTLPFSPPDPHPQIPHTPQSPRRVQRSIDALATAQKHHRIDPSRSMVTGISGRGHMAMLTRAILWVMER